MPSEAHCQADRGINAEFFRKILDRSVTILLDKNTIFVSTFLVLIQSREKLDEQITEYNLNQAQDILDFEAEARE